MGWDEERTIVYIVTDKDENRAGLNTYFSDHYTGNYSVDNKDDPQRPDIQISGGSLKI